GAWRHAPKTNGRHVPARQGQGPYRTRLTGRLANDLHFRALREFPAGPIQASAWLAGHTVQRLPDRRPQFLGRLAANGDAHEARRHGVATARAALGGSVDAAERRGRLHQLAAIDEVLGLVFRAQHDAYQEAETVHLRAGEIMRR